VTALKRDAAKTWESAKAVGKEKTDRVQAKVEEAEQKARKAAKEASDKAKAASEQAKKRGEQAAEESKGLLGDIKARFNRVFGSTESSK